MPPIVRALAHRNYRIYFSGQLVALTGTWMQQMALIWLTYRITNSTFMLGLITFAGQVPLLVLSPLGGVLSDRFERRTLLLWTQWLALVQASLLALLAFTVPLQAWMLIVLALCLGLINAIDQPVRQSFVAELVDRPEDIANAVALNSVTIHSTRFVGPAIGGVVVTLVGEGVCFILNALSFLAMIVALRAIRPRTLPRRHHSVLEGLRAGFRYAYEDQRIRVLLLLATFMSLFGMAPMTLLPWFAKNVFAGEAQTYGFLSAAGGIGSFMGALFLASRIDAAAIQRNIGHATLIAALMLFALSFTSDFWLAMAELAVLGFCTINAVAASNAVIQSAVNDEMRGRVMAIFTVAFFGMTPLGSLGVGTASKLLGPRPTMFVCSLVILAVGIFVFVFLKRYASHPSPGRSAQASESGG
jgi:MFS family permease